MKSLHHLLQNRHDAKRTARSAAGINWQKIPAGYIPCARIRHLKRRKVTWRDKWDAILTFLFNS